MKNHPRLNDALFSHDRRNILELGTRYTNLCVHYNRLLLSVGAGTGIVTLIIASLRSSFNLVDVGTIITTDLRAF